MVGGGASGLALAASLGRLGTRPVVLDRDASVGGTWARRYQRLHLHTVRAFSGLPFLGLPRTLPRYVPAVDYARYLADYASKLGIDVRLGESVLRVERGDRDWSAETSSGKWSARALVIATGRHNVPRVPEWPGARDFRGRLLHSHDYSTGREFERKAALVVGIGNSGAEIATDLVECGASRVAIAVRTPPPITSREIAGIPVQLLGIAMAGLPPAVVDRAGVVLRRWGTGDLSRHGLGAEKWGPFTARRPPVIDVGFLAQLRAGRIEVVPDVARFLANGVVLTDGRELTADVVVAATGYTTGLESLIDEPGALDERGYPSSDAQPGGLFFAGFSESPRGQLYEANRTAGPLARAIVRFLRG